jgi:3-phosphoshikimate 1-carboxyvinyltransferase
MKIKVCKSTIKGRIRIPGSKSHTIRAVYIASYADGESRIIDPLRSADTDSAIAICRQLGAEIREDGNDLLVRGFGGNPTAAVDTVDVGNSGTSLRIGLGAAALAEGATRFTGDEQIQSRPVQPLLDALNNLGAEAVSDKGNGMAPVTITGPIEGGKTDIDAVTSQYLTALLMNCPLAPGDTEITVTNLNEAPYVDMTLWWLDRQGIKYENDDYKVFKVKGGQAYQPFESPISADFSSATFFIVLAAISGGEITFENLDLTDPQGDKEVLNVVKAMGADVIEQDGLITVKGGKLKGVEADLNAIPDSLPALAVAGCFADGETRLINVPQARLKETDRIKVMHDELAKMGAYTEELDDGLIIRKSNLTAAACKGHADHRVVMALSLAGLCIEGETTIDTAEAVGITFPNFAELITACGGKIEEIPDY